MSSMQGRIKKRPGPFAPPGSLRPKRKMTARSYSVTIYENISNNWMFSVSLFLLA